MKIHDQKPTVARRHALEALAREKRALTAGARRTRAMRLVHRNMVLTGAVGLLPAPFINQLVIGGLLAKMVVDVLAVYGVDVNQHRAKTLIAAVLGGAHAEWIARYLLVYANRYLPGAHSIGRIVTRPIVAAATTYAIGLLFVHHLDRGAWMTVERIAKPGSASLPPPSPAGTKE